MKASGPSPEGPCFAGFYCGSGSQVPNETEADAGYYAPVGSSAQRPCQVGTYQPFKKQGSCDPCRSGHFCQTTKMTTTSPCRAGYYCPEGSEVEIACPVGTYNNFTVQNSSAACLTCPKGKYCRPSAQTYPTGKIVFYRERAIERERERALERATERESSRESSRESYREREL